MGTVVYNVNPTTVSLTRFNNKLDLTTPTQNHLIPVFCLDYALIVHVLPNNNESKPDLLLSLRLNIVLHIFTCFA